jgi:hypothetical protein
MRFLSGEGEEIAVLEKNAPDIGTLHLVMPSSRFPEGRYSMVLLGLDPDSEGPTILETYRFRTVIRE